MSRPDPLEYCARRWPLVDGDEFGAQHWCALPEGHDGPHRCPHDDATLNREVGR